MSDSKATPGIPEDPVLLVEVLDTFASMDRYSRNRQEVLEQLSDSVYACRIVFESSERTYGYTADERFRNGRTVIGRLEDTEHRVSLQMAASQNEQVEALVSGDILVQAGRFVEWSSIYDRFELQAAPSIVIPPTTTKEEVVSGQRSPAQEVAVDGLTEDEPCEDEAAVTPQPEEPEVSDAGEKDDDEPADDDGAVIQEAAATPPVSQPLRPEDRNAFLDGEGPVTSAELIHYLATSLECSDQVVTEVVDGFWNYVLQPDHYQGRNRNWVLPHFGTFSLVYESGQASLGFRSRPCRELRGRQANRWNQVASDRWIRFYQGSGGAAEAQDLSIKRRISVWVAEQTDVPLRTVHRVLWELLHVVCEVMAEGRRVIRWAMRGEMYRREQDGNEEDTSTDCYVFRTYGRLRKLLPHRVVPANTASTSWTGIGGFFKPKPRFQGPGVLRGSVAQDGSAGPSIESRRRSWLILWLFVISLNFLPWKTPFVRLQLSLREQMLVVSVVLPLVLSIIFHVMGSILFTLLGKPSKHFYRRTAWFFVVISAVSGGIGFFVVLLQWVVLN